MQTLLDFANWLTPLWLVVWNLLGPFMVPGGFWLAWMAVKELKRRGYSTTYANALIRAVGAGFQKAKDAGLDPFSPLGRLAVASGGAEYLMSQIPAAITWLGITEAQHHTKVLAQLDALVVQGATGGGLDAATVLKMAATTSINLATAGLKNDDGTPMTPEQIAARFGQPALPGLLSPG